MILKSLQSLPKIPNNDSLYQLRVIHFDKFVHYENHIASDSFHSNESPQCSWSQSHYPIYTYIQFRAFISHPEPNVISNSRHKSANVFSLQRKFSNTIALDKAPSPKASPPFAIRAHHTRSVKYEIWFPWYFIVYVDFVFSNSMWCVVSRRVVCRFYPLEHYTFAYMFVCTVFAPLSICTIQYSCHVKYNIIYPILRRPHLTSHRVASARRIIILQCVYLCACLHARRYISER